MSKRYLIIGASAAGISAAETLRSQDKDAGITVISSEDYNVYCRCLLSYFLAGDIKESALIYRSADFLKENNIEFLPRHKAVQVKPKKNSVVIEVEQGGSVVKKEIEYDYLILALGGSAKFPDIKGIHKRGVVGFRSIADIKQISELLPLAHTACVLGGGLIGLKAAYALSKRGIEVKVIVSSNRVLSQILDNKAADIFLDRLRGNKIEILTNTDVVEVIGNGDAKAIRLDNNKVIGTTLIIIGKGVNPNIELAKDALIQTDKGIVVDDYMRTNIENIFACGDVCQAYDITQDKAVVNALWPHAVEQGHIAALNITGKNLKYDGSLGMNSVEFFDLPVISLGITSADISKGFKELVKKREGFYRKLVIKDNRLVGMISVGKLENSGVFLELIRRRIDISSFADELLGVDFSYAKVCDMLE